MYLREATVITPCSCLQQMQDCPNSKLKRLDGFQWFFFEYRRDYQSKLSTDHLSGEQWYEIVVRWPEIAKCKISLSLYAKWLHRNWTLIRLPQRQTRIPQRTTDIVKFTPYVSMYSSTVTKVTNSINWCQLYSLIPLVVHIQWWLLILK